MLFGCQAANPLGGVPAFSPATVAKPTMQFTVPSFAPAVAAPAFGTKPAFPAFGVAAKPFSFTPAGTGGAPPSKNALSNVTPAAITGVLPPPAGPPPPGPPPPGKPTFSMPPSTAFGVGALAGAGTGTGPVQADTLVAAFKKAVDGPSYAAVVGALAKLAAGLQREVCPGVGSIGLIGLIFGLIGLIFGAGHPLLASRMGCHQPTYGARFLWVCAHPI